MRFKIGDRVTCDGDAGTVDWVNDSPEDYRVRFDDDGQSAYVSPSDLEPLKRTHDDSGQASADALVTWLGFAGLALVAVALFRVFGHHAGEACGMAVPFFARRTLEDYSGEVTGWTYVDGEYSDEHLIGRAIDVDLSSGWRVRIGRYGALLRETRAFDPHQYRSPVGPDLGPIRTYARDVLYDWSGDTRSYVDGLSDEQLRRRVAEYMGTPYSLGTLYRDSLDEATLAAEETAARASARPSVVVIPPPTHTGILRASDPAVINAYDQSESLAEFGEWCALALFGSTPETIGR